MKQLNKVGVLCTYTFPEGMAPTTRIRAYGKGLVQNGVKVEVVIFQPKSVDNKYPSAGIVDGLHYEYSHVRKQNASRVHKMLVDHPKSIWNALRIIRKSHTKEPFDVILLSFDKIQFMAILIPFIKMMGIKLAFIGDEFPEPIRQLKSELPKSDIRWYKFLYKMIDARVLMTEALQKFYDEKVAVKPTHILCSILNTDRFEGVVRQPVERPYLCYMGNMMLAKDNVDNIIEAFALIANEFPTLDLHLFGTPNATDRKIVEDCIKEHHLENRAFIKGRIDFGLVPQMLANAEILVTSQPITKRAEGGFPTKLAEYMMSHTPAIVTNVGEIHCYVQDGDTVYMVEPYNPEAYADKLRHMLTHKQETTEVANRAYDYAIKNFGAKEVVKGLMDFLSDEFVKE